uniref:30S ribosomal protein S6, chloroplastic n=1 Tax=Erythrotrichia carnea TaxID=35151 RepID=A0A1C9CEF8_9RHOD|nr:ribosomal protein S6 [Erythrotrichia carnea]AOM66747.1 ribosomal protein S6 [Erythrotrichia carnea]
MITLKHKKAINTYETILIAKPENTEDDIVQNLIVIYSNFLKENGAIQIYFQNKGRHHLAYLVQKNSDGIYIHSNYKGSGKIVKQLEKYIRFDEKIIRHMTINKNNMATA